MGPLIPLLWTSGDVCPGFQSQSGSLFACFLACVILRFTSRVTSANRVQALVEVWVGAGLETTTVCAASTALQPYLNKFSFEFFTIHVSVRLSDRSEVTQHKINFVKICSQWGLNSQPPDHHSHALPLC